MQFVQCQNKNVKGDAHKNPSVAPLQQRCESALELTCGTDNLNTVRLVRLDVVIIPGSRLDILILTPCIAL